jgi:hypothetical protein
LREFNRDFVNLNCSQFEGENMNSKKYYKNINEIFADVDNGIEVFWSNLNYKIIKKSFEYYVKSNNSMISFLDGNGEPNVNISEVFSHSNT